LPALAVGSCFIGPERSTPRAAGHGGGGGHAVVGHGGGVHPGFAGYRGGFYGHPGWYGRGGYFWPGYYGLGLGLGLGFGLGYGLGYGYGGYGYGGYGYGGYGGYGYGPGYYPAYAPVYGDGVPYAPNGNGYPVVGAPGANGGPQAAQGPTVRLTETDVLFTVRVPPDATVWLNGTRTTQNGTRREFMSSGLVPGRTYTYEIAAQWTGPDGKVVDVERRITVVAGERRTVDFLAGAPIPGPGPLTGMGPAGIRN
jgi:uncharacterized protein (TIGR03000 family)